MHTYLETGTIGATVSLTLHKSPHQGLLMTVGCVGSVLICSLTVAASEVQMMTLPHTQYVIAETNTPVSGVNSSQVKTVSKNERLCFKVNPVYYKCITLKVCLSL